MIFTGRKNHQFGIFTMAKDSRLAKCKVCETNVLHGGQCTKLFTMKDLVHHLKDRHREEYARYKRLKEDSDKKQKPLLEKAWG